MENAGGDTYSGRTQGEVRTSWTVSSEHEMPATT